MMTWCWCHPHKLLHTHPRSQRGCDLVEKVVIVILVLPQNIIIVIVIIAMIRKLLVSWMLSSFSAVSLSQSSQPCSQAQGQASSHFNPIIWASLIWYYPVTGFQYDPIWSTMIHYGLVWSKSQSFDSHLPPPQPPYIMLWQPLSWKSHQDQPIIGTKSNVWPQKFPYTWLQVNLGKKPLHMCLPDWAGSKQSGSLSKNISNRNGLMIT